MVILWTSFYEQMESSYSLTFSIFAFIFHKLQSLFFNCLDALRSAVLLLVLQVALEEKLYLLHGNAEVDHSIEQSPETTRDLRWRKPTDKHQQRREEHFFFTWLPSAIRVWPWGRWKRTTGLCVSGNWSGLCPACCGLALRRRNGTPAERTWRSRPHLRPMITQKWKPTRWWAAKRQKFMNRWQYVERQQTLNFWACFKCRPSRHIISCLQ